MTPENSFQKDTKMLKCDMLVEHIYRKSSIKPPGGLFNFGPSRGGGLLERGAY